MTDPTPPEKRKKKPAAVKGAVRDPHTIQPTAVYTIEVAQAALNLKESTIRTEVRKRRLRVAKRAGRYYILGAWLLQWLEGGELHRQAPPGDARTGPSCGTPARRNGRAPR